MATPLETFRLGQPPWPTFDPFLFCVHHLDEYPRGNEAMGPVASLAGRDIGMDFAGKDGWRMYHGDKVPGFPRHPHRGFETVTLARQGFIDHADSLGATARFGHGDCQWMTAARGIEHCEMFPLVHRDSANPGELFQIWLNLPREKKLVTPNFTMLWSGIIPKPVFLDAEGREVKVAVMAGDLGEHHAPPPPPDSWAADPQADVAIWPIQMAPHAEWTLPPAKAGTGRTLYFFMGNTLDVDGEALPVRTGIRAVPDAALPLKAGPEPVELLLLQGRPIDEPVVHYGPFVMNTRQEIQQAMLDYRRGAFGEWPWPSSDPVHERQRLRFAVHADGRVEEAG